MTFSLHTVGSEEESGFRRLRRHTSIYPCTAVVIMCVQPLLFINLMFLVACIVIFLYFQSWLLQFFDNYIDFFKLAREMENRFEMLELKNWMKVTCIEWQLIMVQGGCRPQQPNTLKGQGTYCLYLQTKCIFSVNNLAQQLPVLYW